MYLAQVAVFNLATPLLTNWIAPADLAGIALISIIFIKDRAWMKLISFLGIAALVAIPIFFGDELFGGEGLFKVGSDLAKQVNAVEAYFAYFGKSSRIRKY